VSTQFVEDSIVGAKVLGIYGMAGLGKSMLAKALHDYFYREFLGKVCYVDMRNGSRARRQKWMLKMLCGFEKDVVANIGGDVEKVCYCFFFFKFDDLQVEVNFKFQFLFCFLHFTMKRQSIMKLTSNECET